MIVLTNPAMPSDQAIADAGDTANMLASLLSGSLSLSMSVGESHDMAGFVLGLTSLAEITAVLKTQDH